uniref:Putative secreted peptide n=1 Tax=Anopheles braziliensis TaxID=58242 RepID=A0A2M3ZTP8_9DIPT
MLMMAAAAAAAAVMAFVTALTVTVTTTAMRVESDSRTHAHHCGEIYLFRFTTAAVADSFSRCWKRWLMMTVMMLMIVPRTRETAVHIALV